MSLLTTFGVLLTLLALMLFWLGVMVRHGHRQFTARIEDLGQRLDAGLAQSREGLAAYKLEVAKSYASVGLIKDVERRLTEHLVRIEAKLGATGGP